MAASFSAASFFAIREEEDQNQMKQQHSSTPPSSSTTPPAPAPPQKKRKNHQPGTPYPDAEVIALSPKTLMATNRFVCEVCNKGFQREQNLQLHRRGHNLPWKLKQKSNNKDQPPPKRKVYLCPEPTCVHHEPSRALGDLTGIKKHFSRKHGEKKWKCDKCSKKYAVQSDWKAHSKTCGTREYRCDCGTLFSRRDSFITHRAFCDALAQESAATQPPNHLSSAISISSQLYNGNGNNMSFAALSQIDQNDNNMLRFGNTRTGQFNHILSPPPPQQQITLQTPSLFNIPVEPNQNQNQNFNLPFLPIRGTNTNSNINLLFSENFNNEEGSIFFPEGPLYHHSPISPHMSATALLQKAAQMGVSSSSNSSNSNNNNNTASSSLLRSFGGITKSDHRAVLLSANNGNNNNNNMQELMNSFAAGFEEACEYNNNNHDGMDHHRGDPKVETMMSSIGGGSDGFTRDFLGVSEIVRNMSGAVSQREQQQQQQQQRGFNLEAEKNTNAAPLTGQSFGGGGNFQ